MTQSIVHVALVVRDYDEAIEFYGNLWDLVEFRVSPDSLGSRSSTKPS